MNKFILGIVSLGLLAAVNSRTAGAATAEAVPPTLPVTRVQVLCTSAYSSSVKAPLQKNLNEQIEIALASAKKEFLDMNYVLKHSLSAPSLGSSGDTTSTASHQTILCATLTMEFSKE